MIFKLTCAAVVLAVSSSFVTAQTFSACNPLKRTDCPANAAIASTQTIDFTKGENKFFGLANATQATYDPALGAVFSIDDEKDAPTFTSIGYIFFGKVDVVLQAAPGAGIVSSIVLQSDVLDEIDWEVLGGDSTQVQTNYFSKGDTSSYDRGAFSPVNSPQTQFHTYTIDWTAEKLEWIIDGTVVRTLTYNDAKGGTSYPQTPMQLKIGTWVAGRKDAPDGTVQWAGGYTDFSKAPFVGYYQKVVVQDYMNGASSASKYVYGDQSGTMGSIKIEQGNGSADQGPAPSAPSTAPSSPPTAPLSPTPNPIAIPTPTSTNGGSAVLLTPSQPIGNAAASGVSPGGANNSSGSRPGSSTTPVAGSSTSAPVSVSSGTQSAANFAFLGAALLAVLSL